MLAHLKSVAERGREQTGSGGGANQREWAKLHVDDPRVYALAEGQVDAKVLHRRIQNSSTALGSRWISSMKRTDRSSALVR